MRGLQRLESRLEEAISGMFARAFRSAVQPVEIAAAMQREADNNTQILSRDRRLVPNDYHVELSHADMERLSPYDSAMAHELTSQLEDHAKRQAYVFPGPVTISFSEVDDLSTGRFRVSGKAMASVEGLPEPVRVRRSVVVLEINGTRHPLRPPGLVIGRGTDADIRINDPGVSRRHVEFTVDAPLEPGGPPAIEVRDLGSTNGIRVDGHRATKAALQDGSRVRLGHTDVVVRVSHEGESADRGAASV